MSRKNKNKAVKHQYEIRDLIRNVFCPPFDDDDILTRTMGNAGSDIMLSPRAKEAIMFNIECKRHEDKTWSGSYKSSFEQAFNDVESPLLVRRKNRSRNHYFAVTKFILDIHPGFLRNEDITMHDNLKTFLTSNKFGVSIYSDYIHFNDKKFIEVLTCLKRSYFQ